MTTMPLVEYTTVTQVRGPLLVVRGVHGVGWDEFAQIRLPGGETRHGLVLDVDRDLAVVQVLEGTAGIQAPPPRSPSTAARCRSRSAPAGSGGSATAAANPSTTAHRSSVTAPRRSPGIR